MSKKNTKFRDRRSQHKETHFERLCKVYAAYKREHPDTEYTRDDFTEYKWGAYPKYPTEQVKQAKSLTGLEDILRKHIDIFNAHIKIQNAINEGYKIIIKKYESNSEENVKTIRKLRCIA